MTHPLAAALELRATEGGIRPGVLIVHRRSIGISGGPKLFLELQESLILGLVTNVGVVVGRIRVKVRGFTIFLRYRNFVSFELLFFSIGNVADGIACYYNTLCRVFDPFTPQVSDHTRMHD